MNPSPSPPPPQVAGIKPSDSHRAFSRALKALGVPHKNEKRTSPDNLLSMDIALGGRAREKARAGREGGGSGRLVRACLRLCLRRSFAVAPTAKCVVAVCCVLDDSGFFPGFSTFPFRQVALEVDGPMHFLRNTGAPTGRTLLRDRLLAARGVEVVSLPWTEWPPDLTDAGAHAEYLRRKARARRNHFPCAATPDPEDASSVMHGYFVALARRRGLLLF